MKTPNKHIGLIIALIFSFSFFTSCNNKPDETETKFPSGSNNTDTMNVGTTVPQQTTEADRISDTMEPIGHPSGGSINAPTGLPPIEDTTKGNINRK